MEFDSENTISEVLQELRRHYNLPELDLENVPNTNTRRAITLVDDGVTHVAIDRATGDRFEVDFQGGTGVRYNVALRGARQENIAAGPGSSVVSNSAEDAHTIQKNFSLCVIL